MRRALTRLFVHAPEMVLYDRVLGLSPTGDDAGAAAAPVRGLRVLPSPRMPMFLASDIGRRALVRALLSNWRLHPRVERVRRVISTLGVCYPARRRWSPSLSLLSTESCGATPPGSLNYLVALKPAQPDSKVTIQLLDSDGVQHGFVKVGHNERTRLLVEREVEALSILSRVTDVPEMPVVPELRSVLQDQGLTIMVTAPLPARVRRWPNSAGPPVSAARTVAETLRECGTSHLDLHDAGFWQRQNLLLEQVADSERATARAAARMRRAWQVYCSSLSGVSIEIGGWHGDWVPWNLGTLDDRVVAWDWEYATESAPWGFDLLHYLFSVDLDVKGSEPAKAVSRLRAVARSVLVPAGVSVSAAPWVVEAYLVERWLRLSAAESVWDLASATRARSLENALCAGYGR